MIETKLSSSMVPITFLTTFACLSAVGTASDSVLSSKEQLAANDLFNATHDRLNTGTFDAIKDSLQANVTALVGRGQDVADLERQQQQLNFIGYLLLSSFLLVLSAVLVLLVWNLARARHYLFENDSSGTSRSMKMRIQRRYETIEHWIITKKVQLHDSFSDVVVDNFGHHDSNNTTIDSTEDKEPESGMESSSEPKVHSARLDDDEPRECPICMSTLKAGEIVSWSANEKCNHTYHHQCIKEWLLRHVDCCLCKEVFLPVDEKKGKDKQSALQELSCRYAASSATSYFCEKRGLVRIPRSVRCTRAELVQLEQRIFQGTVAPLKLVGLRGGRECTTTSHADDFPPTSGMVLSSTAETVSFDEDDTRPMEVLDAPSRPTGATSDSIVPFSPSRGIESSSCDLELGTELLSASYHLERKKSELGDNRCRVEDTDDSVEVHETSSSEHINDEDDLEVANEAQQSSGSVTS